MKMFLNLKMLLFVATISLIVCFSHSNNTLAFMPNIHKNITFKSFVNQAHQNIIDTLSTANVSVDGIYSKTPGAHFDSCSWKEGWAFINTRLNKAVDIIFAPGVKNTSDPKVISGVCKQLGESLHTIQDFYSHSNWIESHSYGTICPFLSSKPSGWVSGYYPVAPYGYKSHTQMNKDNIDRPGYYEAEADAILASQDLYNNFVRLVKKRADSKGKDYKTLLRGLGFIMPGDRSSVIDSAIYWPSNGKVYFFKGNKYICYSLSSKKPDAGYPKTISQNTWPGLEQFPNGIDDGFVAYNNKAYFFKGSQYVKYNIIGKEGVDTGYPKNIIKHWDSLSWNNIDAMLKWPTNKIYFFKGSEYIRYSAVEDKVDTGYPRKLSNGDWPGLEPFANNGIDSAFINPKNNKAYFFKGYYYIQYDLTNDRADDNYPKKIDNSTWPGLKF